MYVFIYICICVCVCVCVCVYVYISSTFTIYTFENKKNKDCNHQVEIFLCTWNFSQQEPVHRGY